MVLPTRLFTLVVVFLLAHTWAHPIPRIVANASVPQSTWDFAMQGIRSHLGLSDEWELDHTVRSHVEVQHIVGVPILHTILQAVL